jgi:hypothetical protein
MRSGVKPLRGHAVACPVAANMLILCDGPGDLSTACKRSPTLILLVSSAAPCTQSHTRFQHEKQCTSQRDGNKMQTYPRNEIRYGIRAGRIVFGETDTDPARLSRRSRHPESSHGQVSDWRCVIAHTRCACLVRTAQPLRASWFVPCRRLFSILSPVLFSILSPVIFVMNPLRRS